MNDCKKSRGLPGALVPVVAALFLLSLQWQEPGRFSPGAGILSAAALCLLLPFGRKGLLPAVLLLAYLAGFQAVLQLRSREYLPFSPEEIREVRGLLREEPVWSDPRRLRLELSCRSVLTRGGSRAAAKGTVTIFLPAELLPPDPLIGRGSPLRIRGHFLPPPEEGRGLFFRGRSLEAAPAEGAALVRLKLIAALRRKCRRAGEGAEVLLPALILGLSHPRRQKYAALFRRSGTAHILALSGFHAGLVGLLLFGAGRLLFGRRGGYRVSMAGLLLFLWLAGFRPSLVRAVAMYLLFAAGRLSHRHYRAEAVLLFTYLFWGLVDPPSIHSLSSRLSYLALGGILVSGRRLNTLLEPVLPRWLRLPLCASLGAQLWTTALVWQVFGESYPAGIAASLVLTPLVSLYLYGGIFWLLLPVFPVGEALFAPFFGGLEFLLEEIGGFFGAFPPVEAPIAAPGPFLLSLIPVLLLEFYRPGRFHGQRKAGFKLRLRIGDQSPAGDNGAGPPQALGAEFPDQPGRQGEDYPPAGPSGGGPALGNRPRPGSHD